MGLSLLLKPIGINIGSRCLGWHDRGIFLSCGGIVPWLGREEEELNHSNTGDAITTALHTEHQVRRLASVEQRH